MQQKIQSFLAYLILFSFTLCAFSIWSGVTFFSTEAYNEWRLFEVFILSLLSIYYLFIPSNFINYNKLSVLVLLILLFGFFSIYNAIYITRAIRDWAIYSSIILGCISLSHIIINHPKHYKICLILLCTFPFLFVINFLFEIIFYLFLPIDDKAPVVKTFTGQFNNPRIFADTALPILFLLIGLLQSKVFISSTKIIFLLFFTLFSLCTVFMFSGGRGSLLSLIITVLFFIIILPKTRQPLKKATIFFMICFILGIFLNITVGDLHASPSFARNDSSGRTLLILQSIEYLKDNLLFGIGPAQFEHSSVPVSHPHNLFLQFFVEWGLVSGSCLIFLLITIFLSYIKKAKVDDNQLNNFILMSAFAFILNCNFNGAHIYPSSQIYALFIFSNVIANYHHQKHTNSINTTIHNYVKFTQFIFTVLLLVTTYKALGCGNIVTSQKYTFGPRFWSLDSIHSDNECPNASTFFKFNH